MASFKSVDSRVGMLSKLFQYFQGLSAIQQYYEAKNGIVKQATEYAQLQGFTSYPHMPFERGKRLAMMIKWTYHSGIVITKSRSS